MKFVLSEMRVGQKVWGEVVERLSNKDIIISFRGDLMRVANETNREFYDGQRVQLRVTSVKPLCFSLVPVSRNYL